MPLFPSRTTLVLGTLATMASTVGMAGEVMTIADRCAVYGPGMVELGNGTCAIRRTDSSGTWIGGAAASSAGLRSDGLGMLPGAGNARHLRIQADPYLR